MAILIIWLLCAFICYGLAKEKGRNVYIAIIMGLLFGIFAVLGYYFIGVNKEYQLKKAKERIEKIEEAIKKRRYV